MAADKFAELTDPSQRPFTTFRFLVEVTLTGGPSVVAGFSEVDGLEATIEPKTIREGGRNTGPVHLLGPTSYGQLTLKRGMTTNFALWQWFTHVTSPGFRGARAQLEIVLLGEDGTTENARFLLDGCLPVRLKAPGLNAREGNVAIEEMAIVYESLRLKGSAVLPPETDRTPPKLADWRPRP
jgi:phage tail-like protein